MRNQNMDTNNDYNDGWKTGYIEDLESGLVGVKELLKTMRGEEIK